MDPRRLCFLTLTLTLLTLLLPEVGHLVHAFSQGAPDVACGSMTPIHQAAGQPTNPPYSLNVSAIEVKAGDIVKVTLTGTQAFMGFMATAVSSDFPVGTLKNSDSDSKVVCNELSVTHTGPGVKKSVTFEWTAPDDLLDGTSIYFKATVVQQRIVFWENVKSTQPVIFIKPNNAPPSPGAGGSSSTSPSSVLPPPSSPLPVTKPPHDHSNHNHGTSPTKLAPGQLAMDPDCGSSKACFHDCKNGHCTFIVDWEDRADEVAMHMRYSLPDSNKHWIAIGFSKDHQMGDDSVTECIMFDDGEVKVQMSFNTGLFNNYIDNKHAALSEMTGTVNNGVLHCHFNRKKQYELDERVFDLTKEYYFMVAVGEALKGNKIPHTFDVLPEVSAHKINLHSLMDVAGKEPEQSTLIKAHGALMIISWVLLISVGVTTAKYGKPMWPKINPFGANLWFQIHRGCMVLVVAFTFVGIALMMVQCRGYCQIPQLPGKSHWPIHPPLGIFVFLLAIANPIMAIFRPAPTAPNRFVFNWSHWGVGVLAWIMGALTIFIGLDLERSHAPPEAMHVMVAYGVYHIFFLVAMETLPRPLRKIYNAVAEKTLQRGRVYNLERAHQENVGYQAEDGNIDVLTRQSSYDSCTASDTAKIQKKDNDKDGKELTREELKVQKLMLLGHYGFVTIFTFCLLLVVFLYTPPAHGNKTSG